MEDNNVKTNWLFQSYNIFNNEPLQKIPMCVFLSQTSIKSRKDLRSLNWDYIVLIELCLSRSNNYNMWVPLLCRVISRSTWYFLELELSIPTRTVSRGRWSYQLCGTKSCCRTTIVWWVRLSDLQTCAFTFRRVVRRSHFMNPLPLELLYYLNE